MCALEQAAATSCRPISQQLPQKRRSPIDVGTKLGQDASELGFPQTAVNDAASLTRDPPAGSKRRRLAAGPGLSISEDRTVGSTNGFEITDAKGRLNRKAILVGYIHDVIILQLDSVDSRPDNLPVVCFTLVSQPTLQIAIHGGLHVHLKGHWAKALIEADGPIKEENHIQLLCKEAKLLLEADCGRTAGDILLFERGCEVWLDTAPAKSQVQAAEQPLEEHITQAPSRSMHWKRFRTFSEAAAERVARLQKASASPPSLPSDQNSGNGVPSKISSGLGSTDSYGLPPPNPAATGLTHTVQEHDGDVENPDFAQERDLSGSRSRSGSATLQRSRSASTSPSARSRQTSLPAVPSLAKKWSDNTRFKLLGDLRPPKSPYDPHAFFDTLVEVARPADASREKCEKWLICTVTDWSTSPLLYWCADVRPKEYTAFFEIHIWKADFDQESLNRLQAEMGAVGAVLEIYGIRCKEYKQKVHGHVGRNNRDFKWRVADPADPRVTALQERKAGIPGCYGSASPAHSFADSGYEDFSTSPSAITARCEISGADDLKLSRSPSLDELGTSDPSLPNRAPADHGNSPPMQQIAIPRLQSSRKLLKLSQIKAPMNTSDPSAFFDCYCEIVQDFLYNAMDNPCKLQVTDFTMNPRFWENAHYPGYSADQIVLEIALFDCPDKVCRLQGLLQGDRILLENVRIKRDRFFGRLEGHIGRNGEFSVQKLAEDSVPWLVLEEARKAVVEQSSQASSKDWEAGKGEDGNIYVVCDRISERLSTIDRVFDSSQAASYHLRGRVIEMEPKNMDAFLQVRCQRCDRFLDPSQARCTNCPDGVLGADLAHHWRFALRIELEPEGSDIRLDVVNEDMAIWVYVDEKEGDEGFMNGLEPCDANLPEARRRLRNITDNRSANNGTNPIFDFCIDSFPEVGAALVVQTALKG